jgi:KaiC/GvpD/RAD55 family RecA-like ATPase
MKEVVINNIKITPLITHSTNPDDVLGGQMFLDPYSNVAIISKKKSGKTTLLYHILKKVCRKGTNVLIFSPTQNKDDTYKFIKEALDKKGCNVSSYSNFVEDGENIINDLLNELGKEEEIEDELPRSKGRAPYDPSLEGRLKEPQGSFEEMVNFKMFGKGINDIEKQIEKKPSKPKKISADYVLVFDDLGKDMNCKTIAQLSKTLRHYKIRCFYLQQYLSDLSTDTRKQIDYALLFKSFNEEKLLSMYESLDLSIDFDEFVELYHYATKDPYNFLYVDVKQDKYRKNFNTEIRYM